MGLLILSSICPVGHPTLLINQGRHSTVSGVTYVRVPTTIANHWNNPAVPTGLIRRVRSSMLASLSDSLMITGRVVICDQDARDENMGYGTRQIPYFECKGVRINVGTQQFCREFWVRNDSTVGLWRIVKDHISNPLLRCIGGKSAGGTQVRDYSVAFLCWPLSGVVEPWSILSFVSMFQRESVDLGGHLFHSSSTWWRRSDNKVPLPACPWLRGPWWWRNGLSIDLKGMMEITMSIEWQN